MIGAMPSSRQSPADRPGRGGSGMPPSSRLVVSLLGLEVVLTLVELAWVGLPLRAARAGPGRVRSRSRRPS